jgi:hypothetical protein
MKISGKSIALYVALTACVVSTNAFAQATSGQTFGKCAFPARMAVSKIIADAVKKDLTAKGFTFPSAAVTFSNLKAVRKALSFTDLTGVTGVAAQTDGSYSANITGTIGSPCQMEATLGIRSAGLNPTTKKRFTNFKSQQVTLSGVYQ